MTLSLFLLATSINIGGILLGGILTENKRFSLPLLSKKLDRKPFNCKPCLTFHILWIMYLIAAYTLHSALFFALGLVLSISTFAILYLESKHKVDK